MKQRTVEINFPEDLDLSKMEIDPEAWAEAIISDPEMRSKRIKDALRELGAALSQKASAETREAQAIQQCRDSGASWAKIAREYGITRQAVFQKWSKKV